METVIQERETKNNYFFTLIKLVLFLVILCFLVELTKSVWKDLRGKQYFDTTLLIASVFFTLCFNIFLVDFSGAYKKIQNFFFHSSFFSLLLPSLLVILGLAYFFLPKILAVSFQRDVFVFLGGFALTIHMIFVAKETKGHNFAAVVNYFFLFSILYILNLIFFCLYLKVSYNISLGEIIAQGLTNGAVLLQNIFFQAFK